MNLTVETIEALRAQGVPAEAILDAVQAALKARIEQQRKKDRERQQRSREARRARRSKLCHGDTRDPFPAKKEGSPHTPLKKKTNPSLREPPSSAPSDEGEQATGEAQLPDDWEPDDMHADLVIGWARRALNAELVYEAQTEQVLDQFLLSFAVRFCEAQADEFRAWAMTWKRISPNWSLRFCEWLRVACRDFQKIEPVILVGSRAIALNEMCEHAIQFERETRESDNKAPSSHDIWEEVFGPAAA